MKPLFATALLIVAAGQTVLAQSLLAQTPATPSTVKPKPVMTETARPLLQTPADTANAMTQADRLSIQSDLAWVSLYNGAINGEVSDRMVAAIKAFQKDHGAVKQTGVLNPKEREILGTEARKLQDNVGWKLVSDPVTGARLGLPMKLLPTVVSDDTGTKWSSATGTIQIEMSRRKESGATTAIIADKEKKANGRKTDYTVIKPDFFVLSGLQGLKKFYMRGQTRGSEVRVLTILYDQATEGTMIPVSVAMSSAFNPFPGNAAQNPSAPTRKTVEYSSGIVASTDGAIVADRQATDGCQSIIIAGHGNAIRVADDETRELALLRIYGANGLKPMAMAGGGGAKSVATVTGIADPQSQGGRAVVTTVPASILDGALSPEPGLGFSGAAVLDVDGKFAGVARLKPVLVAGASGAALPSQATLVTADAVREFLKANAVVSASSASDAKSSVLRVICVRK